MMDQRQPPEFDVETFADPASVGKVVEAILHLIFFHRFFPNISPSSHECLGVTLPYVTDAELKTIIEQNAAAVEHQFKQQPQQQQQQPQQSPTTSSPSSPPQRRATTSANHIQSGVRRDHLGGLANIPSSVPTHRLETLDDTPANAAAAQVHHHTRSLSQGSRATTDRKGGGHGGGGGFGFGFGLSGLSKGIGYALGGVTAVASGKPQPQPQPPCPPSHAPSYPQQVLSRPGSSSSFSSSPPSSSSSSESSSSASRAQVTVQFFDVRRKPLIPSGPTDAPNRSQSPGPLTSPGHPGGAHCWETWHIHVTVARPKTVEDERKLASAMVRTLTTTALRIVLLVNEQMDHIPPIHVSGKNPFPYQIHVGGGQTAVCGRSARAHDPDARAAKVGPGSHEPQGWVARMRLGKLY